MTAEQITIGKQTKEQKFGMIQDFLRMYKGREFDGITAANWMMEVWGIRYDWHDFAFVLDRLATLNLATREYTRTGQKYTIN